MKINMYYPTSKTGCVELARRVAEVHADAAFQYIEKSPCPNDQKSALLDALNAAKGNEDGSGE